MASDKRSNVKALVGIYIRGLIMGTADIVPGISGGTVALITGIYDRLLAAVTAVNLDALQLLFKGRIGEFWQRIDGKFLAVLIAGIGTALVVMAEVIHWLLGNYSLPLWSFFFGLVLASFVFLLVEEIPGNCLFELPVMLIGTLFTVAIGLAPAAEFIDGPASFFVAGALAICAMILPGISGSFVLLLIGMYRPVIDAIRELDLMTLSIFSAGCVVGLLTFSHLLHWVLIHFRRPTMALLTGVLLGSLVILWPWQEVVTSIVDRHGELRVIQTRPMTPVAYAVEYGSSQWLFCLGAAVVGAITPLFAHQVGRHRRAILRSQDSQ